MGAPRLGLVGLLEMRWFYFKYIFAASACSFQIVFSYACVLRIFVWKPGRLFPIAFGNVFIIFPDCTVLVEECFAPLPPPARRVPQVIPAQASGA